MTYVDWLRGSRLSTVLAGVVVTVALAAVRGLPAAEFAADEPPATGAAADDLEQLSKELDAAEEQAECEEAAPATAAVRAMSDAVARRKRQSQEQKKRLMKDPKWKPTHKQVKRLKVASTLNNFCLDSKGRILACCTDKTIRLLTQQGKELDSWTLAFQPQAIAACKKDDTVFVGGEGKISKLDANGKVLLTKEFPRPMTDEELEEAVREQVDSQVKAMEAYTKGINAQLAALKKGQGEEQTDDKGDDSDDEGTAAAENPLSCVAGMSSSEAGMQLQFKDNTPVEKQIAALQFYSKMMSQQYAGRESMEKQVRARLKNSSQTSSYTGVAVGEEDLFIVCSAPGYTYSAWRTNHDLDEPKLIVKGLRGCCGQMDCQTDGRDLWIPVNGEHLVYHYDRDGKVLKTFGKRDAEAADGFGGCCEPKNLRHGEDGYVYCAQSGPPVCVKRYTPDGKFQDVACFPLYETGCVRVSVDLADDKIFLLSPNEGAIYVFAPAQEQ